MVCKGGNKTHHLLSKFAIPGKQEGITLLETIQNVHGGECLKLIFKSVGIFSLIVRGHHAGIADKSRLGVIIFSYLSLVRDAETVVIQNQTI